MADTLTAVEEIEENFFNTAIGEAINNCHSVQDLLPFLSIISLDIIKEFLNDGIETLDDENIKYMYYNSLSIVDILNVDVMQYILSFNLSTEINSVNKLFNSLSIINDNASGTIVDTKQRQYLKLRQKEHQISICIKKTDQALIGLHRKNSAILQKMNDISKDTYNALKQQQIQPNNDTRFDKYFSPKNTIKYIPSYNDTYTLQSPSTSCDSTFLKVITTIKSGDKILLKHGWHGGSDPLDVQFGLMKTLKIQNKDLQIIGIEDDVVLSSDIHGFILKQRSNISVENITFHVSVGFGTNACFQIGNDCSLWLNRCKFEFEINSCVSVADGGNLYIKNCSFIGGSDQRGSAVTIDPFAAKVNVMDCRFVNCGQINGMGTMELNGEFSCIEIEEQKNKNCYIGTKTNMVLLKCIGNTFIDNFGFCVAKKFSKMERYYDMGLPDWFHQYNRNGKHCVFEDNVLQGINGKGKVDDKGNIEIVEDANKLYEHYYNKDISKAFLKTPFVNIYNY